MKTLRNKRIGIRKYYIFGLLIADFFLLGVVCLIYPPLYFYNLLVWQEWDVSDYNLLPHNNIQTAAPAYRFAQKPDEERVSSLFERNLKIDDFESLLKTTDTTAFIVIQDDAVLYEKYFKEYPYSGSYHSFSVAKSYISALIGIAISEGYIRNVNDPITTYLPELKERDASFQFITIENLLQMSSGLQFTCPFCDRGVEAPWGDNIKSLAYPDLRKVLLQDTKIIERAGTRFLYKAYDPQLLSLILERSTGMPASEYLQKRIWEPMRMEYPASWLVDSEKSGLVRGDLGINALPIDYAKFGRLYMNKGNWNGQQIIPENWVLKSTTQAKDIIQPEDYYPPDSGISATTAALFPNGKGSVYYGYLWWGASRGEDSYDFWAHGRLGQWIYVCPSKNLIIVRTGLSDGGSANFNDLLWIKMFYDFASAL